MKYWTFFLFIFLASSCSQEAEEFKYVMNYQEGLRLAKEQNKPIFLYFTWFGNSSTEFTEEFIVYPPFVKKLNDDFINIVLYTDDRTKITESDTLGFNKMNFPTAFWDLLEEKTLRTIGNINAAIEIGLYNRNSQPLYVFRDYQGENLIEPFGYMNKGQKIEFLNKIKAASRAFQKRNSNDR
jgi:thioredoxin-related protein